MNCELHWPALFTHGGHGDNRREEAIYFAGRKLPLASVETA
jgi:hypothetical protein